MVEVAAQDRRDKYGQQWEYGKDALSCLAHITHVAICNERKDRYAEKAVATCLVFLEVAGKACGSNDEHYNILHDSNTVACPERVGVGESECKVALQHINGIFLEWEDG